MPVADYTGLYDLNQSRLKKWALLDTFDWLSPRYDQSQERAEMTEWITTSGFAETAVVKTGFMIVRGVGEL